MSGRPGTPASIPYGNNDARPLIRWWWFEDAIAPERMASQLDWLAGRGFGGVEIAWFGRQGGEPAHVFLSPEWAEMMAATARAARERGLRIDFTFGSAWPFGGTFVPAEDAVMTWNGPSTYHMHDWWRMEPEPGPARVLNHLDRRALARYAEKVGTGLAPAVAGTPAGTTAFFCDSWEVPCSPPLWTEGFLRRFEAECGYDITHLMNYLEYHRHALYDYRKVLSKVVVEEFYRPFTAECNARGAVSRVQCHGAPCDLVAAYAAADVPETETILFDPHFASFAVSAAALAGRPIVSCESFTAIYGLSRELGAGHAEEQAGDIKLLADAMFANGVNQVIWHGTPFGDHRFGATCHVAPDGSLAPHLPELNRYFQEVCAVMRKGRPHTGVAVYLPLEDHWMRHLLPEEHMRPSAHYHWELQHARFPDALRGHQPCWITGIFLPGCTVKGGQIRSGEAEFPALWLDVEWLDLSALRELVRLTEAGAKIVVAREFQEPGYLRHEAEYAPLADRLRARAVSPEALPPPLVEGRVIPEFHCRETEEGMTTFFAHPASRAVTYPMWPGQSAAAEPVSCEVIARAFGRETVLVLDFGWNESLIVEIARSGGAHIRRLPCDVPVSVEGRRFPKDHRYPGYVLSKY
jgi:alpha-L-rhamnosidase